MKITLKTKLLAFLFLTFSLIFGLSAWLSSSMLKEETSRGYEERYGKMVFSYASRVETILNAGTHLAEQMASVIARSSLLPDEELHELLTGIIKLDTVLFAAGVAFEPYAYSPGRHHFGYFIYQSAGDYHTIDMGRDSLRYNYRDTSYKWYSRPLATGKPYWSQPFYSAILTAMSDGVITELKKRENSGSLDGMDMAICVYDRSTGVMSYAGAYRPLIKASAGEVEEIKAVSRSIGDLKREDKPFVEHELTPGVSDTYYLFSDGITDQNDAENRKFGSRRLKELISEISAKEMSEQKAIIETALEEHMGSEEQRDDISVLGFRLHK